MRHFKYTLDWRHLLNGDKFKTRQIMKLLMTTIFFLIVFMTQLSSVPATPSPTRLPGGSSLEEQRSQFYQQQQLFRQSGQSVTARHPLNEHANLQPQLQQPKQQQAVQINTANNQNLNINNNLNNPYTNATYTLLLDLRQQLLVRALKFDEHFRNLLSKSKLSLHNMFTDTYGMIYLHNTEIFTSMYEGLEQYYATGRIQLTKSMESFFERLYQKIFQVYNSNRIFGSNYLECATEQLAQLKPFKDAPDKLITDIRHAFVAARTFHQALNSGMDIIKSIISLGQPPQCTNLIGEKLLKSRSSDYPRPCLDYCEQVISRCIGRTNLESLNEHWRTYVSSLGELAKKLSVQYNIETIIGPIDVQISEAIMNFQDNAHNITNQIFLQCGGRAVAPGASVAGSAATPVDTGAGQVAPLKAAVNNRLGKRAAGSQQLVAVSRATGSQQPIRQQPAVIAIPQQDDRHVLALGKESPVIINEIRDYMLTSKSFWSSLPNSVCTRSNLTVQTGSGGPINPLNQRLRQQQQQQAATAAATGKCFQETLGLGDMNLDLRYRNEIQRQAHLLDVINAKIINALHGIEIDWSQGPDQKPPAPTQAPTPWPATSASPAGAGSSLEPNTGSGDPDSETNDDYDNQEDELEHGSGDQPNNSQSPTTTAADPDEDENNNEEPDDDIGREDTSDPQQPTNNEPQPEATPSPDSDLTGSKPVNELDLDQTNVLITAGDQNAQKSSGLARGPLKVIQDPISSSLILLVCALSFVNHLHAAFSVPRFRR